MGSRWLLVAVGGALGALCRWGVAAAAARLAGPAFAWGTLTVNMAGCLLIGVGLAAAEGRGLLGPGQRLFFMTGFLGALTTFSTYALESVVMLRGGDWPAALANLAANNLGGLLFVVAGLWLGARV